MQPGLLIPVCKLRRPIHQVGPHQIAELPDLQLGIKLGAQVKEVQERTQGEAHNKVLPVVEGENPPGVLLAKPASKRSR